MVQESCENMLCHIANSSENMWKEGSIRDDERPRLPLSEASMMDSVSSSFLATRPPGRGPLLPAPPRAVGAPAPPPSSSSRAAAAAVVAAEASDAGVAIYKSSLEKKLRVNFETLNPKDWLGDIIDNTEGNNAGVRETKPNVNYDGMGSMAMEECSDSEAEMKNGEFDEWYLLKSQAPLCPFLEVVSSKLLKTPMGDASVHNADLYGNGSIADTIQRLKLKNERLIYMYGKEMERGKEIGLSS